ncbi:MAG TPA: bifunctional (p)ppGpp synthetase/guanosine-3',5'-bis(diphosphate) 3'-pyrophosphohydrolase [Blastocatellia bacterium]|nr:bifunctional (p)ppGpp synthetase/guanosine-3',5'-bis(diphosphate) 3'-pyrophosphohydrolase [Blastocatellia bacterium]HMX30006.1 bifunctional (p)ppGpp synthetase/guanosine-3',5'-bis(diphosphate) 3'-pyrophosphohydrolase [Blastocatellia bacterium]
MIRFEDVERKLERYHPEANLDLLRRAYIFSAMMHKDQKRASGEPYLIHPLSVAGMLADMKMDVETVTTGLLHDVVEDTLTPLSEIKEKFGETVAHLVDGVTKISNLGQISKEDAQAENLRKMVLAMVDDVRVVLVKLADRSHNMQTLQFLKPEKRRRIAQETLEVYAPIAHRLGMSKIRAELEELSFQYLEAESYKQLKENVESRRASTEAFLEELKTRIAERLTENGVPFLRIDGRIKRLYSIYLKLKKQNISLDKVYDLAAVRIIVPEMKDCYFALGVMHQHWKPFQDRIKDFIANPRENGYQSLHTSVIGEEGHHFEVQIRTEEMHRIAEEGIAAHWKYKEGKGKDNSEDEMMKWLRRLVETQQDVDAREFVDSLKLELYPKEVYAVTPKGKVIQLPREATPVDFAYAIHTKVGDQCTGAKVNGRIVPLSYQIQNGDVIDILTSPNQKPNRDWLKFVVTSRARNKIKHHVAMRQREEAIEVGRKLFEKEVSRLRLKLKAVLEDPGLEKYRADNGYPKIEDLFAAVGYGKILAKTPLLKLVPADKQEELDKAEAPRLQQMAQVVKRALKLGDDRIAIKGVDNVLVYRAPCCNPIRGEDVIGYITRGKGVGVHASRCKNAANLLVNRERIIEVTWVGEGGNEPYAVKLAVMTEDRTGQLAALTNAVADIKTNIREARTDNRENGAGLRRIELTVDILDLKHLERVRNALRKVQGVLEVERITPQS